MSKTELLDYSALETIKRFDSSTIKENVAAFSSIEQKIRYLEETNKELKKLIEELTLSLEKISLTNIPAIEFEKRLSVVSYKNLIFRNARFTVLEELLFWKDQYIIKIIADKNRLSQKIRES
jgi:seryl-tRNA synthetase